MALAVTPALCAPNHGSDVFHLDSRVVMDAGVEPDAVGVVVASEKAQGKALKQELQIELTGLDTNGLYTLEALMGDDTNLVDIAVFAPDGNGDVSLNFRHHGNGKGKGKGNVDNLPPELNPIGAIRGLVVLNTNSEAVLTADMSDPQHLQYLVKKKLSGGDASGLLQIHVTPQLNKFRLTSSGLMATNSYLLVINGDVDQAVDADAKGRLTVNSLANGPANLLNVHSLALWDSGSNVVFSAEIP
jgi:hypothetical protein